MGYGGKQAIRSGDVRRFNFTGNGSNTAFDLGFTPSTQNQLIVTVNGLVQHYDAFSVTGSVLTFTGTPASGDAIQVTAVVDAVGVAAIPDGAIANLSSLTVSTNTATIGTSVYVVANGNVGVNSSTPNNSLDIKNSNIYQIRTGDGATYYDFGRNNVSGYFNFYGNQTGYTGYLFGGADGTRMTIVANGAVGIAGDPYYAYKLAVNGSIVATNGYYIEGGTRGGYATSITNDGGNSSANNAFRVMNASGSVLMNSTYGGQVTMPYQPAFSVYGTQSSLGNNGTVIPASVDLNNGSHYSTSTGRFTAPVAGMYYFIGTLDWNGATTGNWYGFQFKKNGASVGQGIWQNTSTANDNSMTQATILSLAVGDYVTMQASYQNTPSTTFSNFAGHLIG